MKLYSTDFVVLTEDNIPLRYSSGDIGIWAEENLSEIPLEIGEKYLPSNELKEPFKSELTSQIKRDKRLLRGNYDN